ncbi:DNA replication factor GINS [Methanocalculus alkaliphilus]|uniref:hypothetical protein n=1 Tax=Methanocalculus alkaliphilus TaxID=768730 RepID=UPI00209FF4DE|nr:hypothetical protein [Methanocalculus alkaliphilus]MCP1714750.1 DNA replication factor GINS [Methanocalculus alkaliphilus]
MSISFDRLRSILFDERASGTLTDIPSEFYQNVHEEIERMYRALYDSGDPLSEETQDMIRQIESIKSFLQEIFAIRTSRIIELATAKANGDMIDREMMRLMTSEERLLFDNVSQAVSHARSTMVELHIRRKTPVIEEKVEEEAGEVITPQEVTPVRITTPVEQFMGYDGRTYSLLPGDIVVLPRPNADVLCNRNIALNTRIRK